MGASLTAIDPRLPPIGWRPKDPDWAGRLARRLVWRLSDDLGEDVIVSAHLVVRLGRANPRHPLVAAVGGPATHDGTVRVAPMLVVALAPAAGEPAWWRARAVEEVWVLRRDGGAHVHRNGEGAPLDVAPGGRLVHAGHPVLAVDLGGLRVGVR
jgi:hypothetical protein